MSGSKEENFKSVRTQSIEFLKQHGFSKTEGRILILSILFINRGPLSIDDLKNKILNKINIVTIYRFLNALVKKRLIKKIYLKDGRDYFEYQENHHHHIVCRNCGEKEPVDLPIFEKILKGGVLGSKNFEVVDDHILEFFGLCKKCVCRI